MGPAIETVSSAVSESGPVERVYVRLFNEGRPGHVHFHVEPRFADETQRGQSLVDSDQFAGSFNVVHALVTAASRFRGERTEPSRLVRGVLSVSSFWNRGPSLYRKMPMFGGLDRAESYVSFWFVVWISALLVSWFAESWPIVVVISLLWSYRLIDLVLYEVGILLNASPTSLMSIPRALLLRVGNIAEVFLATSALLLASPGAPTGRSAILQSYTLAALQPEFGQPGLLTDMVLVVNWIAVLLILTGGIAMLIGKIGETFSERSS